MSAPRRSAGEQLHGLAADVFGVLTGDREKTAEVKERLTDEVVGFLGKRVETCAQCGGPVRELVAADGETRVQICARDCGGKGK